MNMAYNYGKVALFVLAAMAGKNDGVVAGLVGCGLIKSIVSPLYSMYVLPTHVGQAMLWGQGMPE